MAARGKMLAGTARGRRQGRIDGTGTVSTAGASGARSLGGQCRQGAVSRTGAGGRRKGDMNASRMARSGRSDGPARFRQY